MRDSRSARYIVLASEKGYVVTSEGNVISPFSGKFKKLGTSNSDKPYPTVSVSFVEQKRRVTYHLLVHQLQAYQKFGVAALGEGVHVRHLDGDRFNNCYDNIDIGTQSDNMQDIPKETRLASAISASTNIRKFTDIVMEEIRFRRGRGATYKELMEAYDISSKGTLWEILNRKYVTVK